MKVLLVDDEEAFVTTLAERLEKRGFAVQAVGSGEEAVQVVETDPPQVVVLDLKMPGMNGIEALKYIMNISPGLPVLLLTGYGSTEEGIKGMQLGACDYLMKPLNIDELIDKMKEAVTAGSSHKR